MNQSVISKNAAQMTKSAAEPLDKRKINYKTG